MNTVKITNKQLFNVVDWSKIFELQFGSRDSIRARVTNNESIIVDWSNDNGWQILANGVQIMVTRDGKLGFIPNATVFAMLAPHMTIFPDIKELHQAISYFITNQ